MRRHAVIGAALLLLLTPFDLFGQSQEVRPNRRELANGLSVEGMIGMGWIGWSVGPEHEIDQGDWDPIAGLTVGYGF